LPRFDSNACFATLLGTLEHGRWRISPADPRPRVSRAYRDGTMVLETAFETADGRVALIDFMPIGQANSSVIRLIKGERGKVAMRLHLTPRFDYGATVPWVTRRRIRDERGGRAEPGGRCVRRSRFRARISRPWPSSMWPRASACRSS
jgi:GH15 family glucan-1,4-alpha-glucosidase